MASVVLNVTTKQIREVHVYVEFKTIQKTIQYLNNC